MPYQNRNRQDHSIWRKKNLHKLIVAGIPERVANDERQFWFLVQEGEELGTGWNVDWLSQQQARDLYNLLAAFLGEESNGWDLLMHLRAKLDDSR